MLPTNRSKTTVISIELTEGEFIHHGQVYATFLLIILIAGRSFPHFLFPISLSCPPSPMVGARQHTSKIYPGFLRVT